MIELCINIGQLILDVVNVINSKISEINEAIEKNKKWKLYLYLKGQCIKCLKIDKDFAPMNKIYVVKVRNKRHLLGTNKPIQIVVRSYKYKYTDEVKKTAHIEVIMYEGVDVNE